jgi:hypothetical protein
MEDYSPERAVFWAIAVTVLTSLVMALVRRESLKDFGLAILDGLREGAIGSVQVAAACAAAGIIIGSITMTGLGLKFSSFVVDASQGYLFLALPFTMIACLFLGMGVPTTAQYIIITSLVAPALVDMGVLAIAAIDDACFQNLGQELGRTLTRMPDNNQINVHGLECLGCIQKTFPFIHTALGYRKVGCVRSQNLGGIFKGSTCPGAGFVE